MKYKKADIWNYMGVTSVLNTHLMGHKGYAAGGCFKNLFNNEPVKDIDIFFKEEKDFHEAVTYFKDNEDYYKFYSNPKVQAYKHEKTGVTIELIKHLFGEPEEVLDKFDFTITKVAFVNNYLTDEQYEEWYEENAGDDFPSSYFLIHPDFFEHLHTKRLVVDDEMVLPVNTIERMFRYAKYGYYPCKETKIKLIEQIRALDNFNPELISIGLYDGLD